MAKSSDSRRARRNVILAAVVAGISGLLFGYDTGVIASALLFITPEFGLNTLESGIIVASVPIGAAAGATLAGPISDRYGRRYPILGAAALFIVGSAIGAAAPEAFVLVIARLIIGLAIGAASGTAPVYVSEIAPPEIRGRLVTVFQLSITVGILIAYLVGLVFEPIDGWRWMIGLGVIPALVLGIGIFRMPKSPRWLVMAGQDYAARKVLNQIREHDPGAIDHELEGIKREVEAEPGTWHDVFSNPVIRAALLVGLGLALFQQLTGINTVIYYAPQIVQLTGITSDSAAIIAALGVGVVNVGMTVLAVRYVDRAGRRPLLIFGTGVMALALFGLGASFIGADTDTWSSILAIGSLLTYVAAFAISLGPIFWLVNSEIFPMEVRSKAAGLCVTVSWVANFAVSLTFLVLLSELGNIGTFWLYGAICVLALLFAVRYVPETKGKRLEQIQEIFRARAGVS